MLNKAAIAHSIRPSFAELLAPRGLFYNAPYRWAWGLKNNSHGYKFNKCQQLGDLQVL